jgi:hypothetical protein
MFDEFDDVHLQTAYGYCVYLSEGTIKDSYVGETTDTYARMITHLKTTRKIKLTTVHLMPVIKVYNLPRGHRINLIKYWPAHGQYKLIIGIFGH